MSFPSFTDAKSDHICRCCLGREGVVDICENNYDFSKKEVYKKMLEDVFNIQTLQETISIVQYICGSCVSRLQDASSFKDMVIKNEKMYLECLQRLHENDTKTASPELNIEDIKAQFSDDAMDMDMKEGDEDDDDDEILANLYEASKNTVILEKRTKHPENVFKSNISKIQLDIEKPDKIDHGSKTMDHRGAGPILRENSLKLLTHSTATVFQWNKSRYRCFCCKEPFSDIDLLKQHTDDHTIEEIQKKIINQQNRLVKVDITNLNCKLCGETLKDLDHLIKHLIDHSIEVNDHLLVPFKIESKLNCQICSEPFSLFRLLNIHMNKHYQKHVCYVCGAGFSNLVFLNLHRTRTHRPIQCNKCNVVFVSRIDKKNHDIDIHGAKFERKNRFPCPFCSERFFQENLRVKHLVDMHGMQRPEFNCQFCSKSFITKSLVNNHVKVVHMKEKNHECELCHSFFYTKSDVTRHKVTHTGEKNYTCSLCSNTFASKDSLRRHMKRSHVVP